jgi:hypothetical protein
MLLPSSRTVGTAQTLPNLAGLAGEVTVTGDGIFGTG